MKKHTLYIIDIILSILLVVVLVSSIINEVLGGSSLAALSNTSITIFHISVCLVLMTLAFIHIKAHYANLSRWINCLKKGKMQTRVVFILCAMTLVTGIASMVVYFGHGHTPLGGVHGKIGFVALALMILHLVKRFSRLGALSK